MNSAVVHCGIKSSTSSHCSNLQPNYPQYEHLVQVTSLSLCRRSVGSRPHTLSTNHRAGLSIMKVQPPFLSSITNLDQIYEKHQNSCGQNVSDIWEQGPWTGKTAVVVPLFGGTTVLSLPGKVCSRVLERRVWPTVGLWISSWSGTLDQLFTLHSSPVHLCFVDLEKAWEHGVLGPQPGLWLYQVISAPSAWLKTCALLSGLCRTRSGAWFTTLMDRISRCSQGPEEVVWGPQDG